jgi:hypothetical protein
MAAPPLFIVDIIGEVVAAVDAVLYATLNKHILYEYGRSIQILQKLQSLNDGITSTTKGSKYPLFALFQDFPEDSAGGSGYYCTVRFPKISIATLTNSTDPPPIRYTQTFKPILYPIYEEFLRQLVRHKNIVGNDPAAISHIKWDRPGTQPEGDKMGSNFNDYVDAIEIQNLQLTFKQIKKC